MSNMVNILNSDRSVEHKYFDTNIVGITELEQEDVAEEDTPLKIPGKSWKKRKTLDSPPTNSLALAMEEHEKVEKPENSNLGSEELSNTDKEEES